MLPIADFRKRLRFNIDRIYGKRQHSSLGKKVTKAWIALGWIISNGHTVFSKRHLELPYLEIMVTQKCSLNCKFCANLMPLFTKPKDMPLEGIIKSMDKLLDSVDRIYILKVLGGEPFMYRPLTTLLQYLKNSPKIVEIEVVTNGTIVPQEEVLACLKHPKIRVSISPYGEMIAKNKQALVETLEQHQINYFFPKLKSWRDFGGFAPRKRSRQANMKMFQGCSLCVTLIEEELFCCPRAGNGSALGLVPKVQGEFVSVGNSNRDAIIKDLYDFSKLDVISTCDYCDNPGPEIPMAEQVSSGSTVNVSGNEE